MSEPNIAPAAAVGGTVLVLGLLSALIRHSILSEPLVALLTGVVLGLPDPTGWGSQETILGQAPSGLGGVAARTAACGAGAEALSGTGGGTRDALFLGRFGPIGVAALYYASLSVREAGWRKREW